MEWNDEVAYLTSWAMVMSGLRLLPKVISGSMTLPQLWSMLMFMAPDTHKSYQDAGVGPTPEAMLIPQGNVATRTILI